MISMQKVLEPIIAPLTIREICKVYLFLKIQNNHDKCCRMYRKNLLNNFIFHNKEVEINASYFQLKLNIDSQNIKKIINKVNNFKCT